jgi:uncharacterized protein YjiS (DUF1127 family)
MNSSIGHLRSFGSEGALTRPGPRSLDFIRLVATASAAGVRTLRELADEWQQHRRRRALQHTLKALDDRTLADIGLHRSDIATIAWDAGERDADYSVLHAPGH